MRSLSAEQAMVVDAMTQDPTLQREILQFIARKYGAWQSSSCANDAAATVVQYQTPGSKLDSHLPFQSPQQVMNPQVMQDIGALQANNTIPGFAFDSRHVEELAFHTHKNNNIHEAK